MDNSNRITIDLEGQRFSYRYIKSREEAWEALRAIKHKRPGLDFETTSLAPSEGAIRLTSINEGDGKPGILIDHFHAGPFEEYAEWFSERQWCVFNACFEGKWIDYYADNYDVDLMDVQHMRNAKMGGTGMMRLAFMVKDAFKVDISKDEQNSNWAAPVLTQSQLDYAALDSLWNIKLYDYWDASLTAAQVHGAEYINSAWRGTVEMEATSLKLDVKYHADMLKWWQLKHDTALRYFRRFTPLEVLTNPASNIQIGNFLKYELDEATINAWPVTGKTQQLQLDRDILTQAAYRLPYPMSRWLGSIIIIRKYAKLISTYGQKLIDAQEKLGRVPSRFNMSRAVTGRYSSSAFNLQNIPHNAVVRRSFIADQEWCLRLRNGTLGGAKDLTKLIIADYKSIEVRVLAEISGDEKLLHDAIYGDPHSRSAAAIFDIDYDYFYEVINSDDPKHGNIKAVFADYRTRAKSFTFQLLYGAGAAALAVVLRCTDAEAAEAINAWAGLYRKAYHYRTYMFEKMMATGFLPVVDGRTIWVPRLDRTVPVAANYPVQGAAATAMYRAIYHTHKSMITDPTLPARMAATVHDELLLYCKSSRAEGCAQLLVEGMIKGWLDVFPNTDTNNLVGKNNTATIADHWGAKA